MYWEITGNVLDDHWVCVLECLWECIWSVLGDLWVCVLECTGSVLGVCWEITGYILGVCLGGTGSVPGSVVVTSPCNVLTTFCKWTCQFFESFCIRPLCTSFGIVVFINRLPIFYLFSTLEFPLVVFLTMKVFSILTVDFFLTVKGFFDTFGFLFS